MGSLLSPSPVADFTGAQVTVAMALWAGVGAIGMIAGSFAAVSVRLELLARWVGARRRDLEGMIDEARGFEPVARPPARKRRRRARGARRRTKS